MKKHRLPLATGVASEPYWSIYATCWRGCRRMETAASERARMAATSMREILEAAAVVYIPWVQAAAVPDLPGVLTDPTYFVDRLIAYAHVRAPFPITFLALGGLHSNDSSLAWSDTELYAVLIAEVPYLSKAIGRKLDTTAAPALRDAEAVIWSFFLSRVAQDSPLVWGASVLMPDRSQSRLVSWLPSLVRDMAAPGGTYPGSNIEEVSEIASSGSVIGLRALSLLESANVELVEGVAAPRAHRANGRPNYEVLIRQAKKRYLPAGRESDHPDWSHRWEVRGHFKHFGPETRLFQRSAAAKILEMPGRGPCVRLWCPPFVKGPADKPLIPKVRRRVVS